eukprot:scaffold151739_cov54-Attheya_sp.AAC.5
MRVISTFGPVTCILLIIQGGALSFHLGGRRATVPSKSVSSRQNVVASSWFLPQKESLLPSFVTEKRRRGSRTRTALEGGYGRAPEYEWMESQFDIELSVMVPADTKSKDLMFRATSRTIELNLTTAEGTCIELLNSTRALKGPVLVDGTFWSFSDDDDVEEGQRKVTVTIEKWMMQPKDEFEHVEYDWGGVYSMEGADEILEKRYDVPEELDVRDYANSLGVDMDNINMTMVDKEMFQKNVNMTRSTMDEMIKAGYVEEITRQADGQEFTTNEDGFAEPFDRFGTSSDKPSSVSPVSSSGGIPFIDTPSPVWGGTQTDTSSSSPPPPKNNDPATRVTENPAVVEPPVSQVDESSLKEQGQSVDEAAVDPIGKITVVRLKEILREQGLKVGGTKSELQDRLRSHVNSMTSKRQDDGT